MITVMSLITSSDRHIVEKVHVSKVSERMKLTFLCSL